MNKSKKTKTDSKLADHKRLVKDHRLRNYVIGLVAALLAFHYLFVILDIVLDGQGLAVFTKLFDFDSENNIPTTVISLTFLVAAQWAFVLTHKSRIIVQKLGWGVIGSMLFYFALDEFFIIHERLGEPVRELLHIGPGSPFFHAWVIPAMVVLVVIGSLSLIISGQYRNLKVFKTFLVSLFFFALTIVTLEILGTFVYSNQYLYRLVTVPLEETTELLMAAFFWLHFRGIYIKRKYSGEQI